MSLFTELKKDRIDAMKNKDAVKKDLLGTLIGDCAKTNKDPSDKECIQMIKKFIKNNNDTLTHLNTAPIFGVSDVARKLVDELNILEAYLPAQLTEEGLRIAIRYAIIIGNYNMGSIMAYLKTNHEGRYDGKLASELIKTILAYPVSKPTDKELDIMHGGKE